MSQPSFMKVLREHDSEFFELVTAVMDKAQTADALDQKTKTLITLALDAAVSHPEGVKALAARARSLGATEQEIVETIRLVFIGAGIPGLVTGLAAFQ